MEGSIWQAGLLEDRLERTPSKILGIDGVPRLIGEYQCVTLYREAFGGLTFAVALKCFYGAFGQTYTAAAVRGLRGLEGLPPRPVTRARWMCTTRLDRSRSE